MTDKITTEGKYTTRDGHEVRVLCVDAPEEQPVVANVKVNHGWRITSYDADGAYYYNGTPQSLMDLIPIKTKHEGWVNVYSKRRSGAIYDTKEEAVLNRSDVIVDTVHIKWEE